MQELLRMAGNSIQLDGQWEARKIRNSGQQGGYEYAPVIGWVKEGDLIKAIYYDEYYGLMMATEHVRRSEQVEQLLP